MSKFSGLFAYSSSSSPAKNLHPLSYSPKGLSPSGISRYIYPTGRPSTVILSLAKHPPASFQSVRRSFMLFAGIKNFFSFFILFFFFAGNVILSADLAVIFFKYQTSSSSINRSSNGLLILLLKVSAMWTYLSVVLMLLCPISSFTILMSVPCSNRWVANEWRSRCG